MKTKMNEERQKHAIDIAHIQKTISMLWEGMGFFSSKPNPAASAACLDCIQKLSRIIKTELQNTPEKQP